MTQARYVFQFRLTLEGVQPPVWRRIQVPDEFTLAQLHRVIQAVMGWEDYHLHQFTAKGRAYGIPDPDFPSDPKLTDDRRVRLADLGLSRGARLKYLYDFGDDWEHTLQLEEVSVSDVEDAAALCLAGEGATPPEDVGGTLGYEDFLRALSDPSHENHKEMKNWIGGSFDPKSFSVEEANKSLRRKFRRRSTSRRA